MIISDQSMDITFGDSPCERLLSSLKTGQTLSAARLLTALDGESEDVLKDTIEHLSYMGVDLDIQDLPVHAADSETTVRLRREQILANQGNLLESLEETDPLKMYLEEIAGIPAQSDICLLARELGEANRAGKEALCRTELLNQCLSRIVELACGYTGHGVLLMDLIQEGSMGLWESLTDYEDGDFEQFRDHCIHWNLKKAVILYAHAAGVGQRLKQAVEDYRAVDEKLLAELGRNPTLEEIAEGLHLSVQETAAVAGMLENARLLQRSRKPEPEQIPQEEDQAVEDTAYFQMRQRISELLSGLSEQDAKLLTLRYGLEGGVPMDPQQVGSRLGLTPEEVVSRETAALAKLRNNNQ